MKTALTVISVILVILSVQIGTAEEREAAIGGLMFEMLEYQKQIMKTATDIDHLKKSIVKTSGHDANYFGLQEIGKSLVSSHALLTCEYTAIFLYALITEEKNKKMTAQEQLINLQNRKESSETLIKLFWNSYSILSKKGAIHVADKAKIHINEAQKLVEQLITFYTSEYQSTN